MVAAKLANMKSGTRTDLEPSAERREVSISQAAQMLKTSKKSVERAKSVQKHGEPELVAAVETGDIAVTAEEEPVRHSGAFSAPSWRTSRRIAANVAKLPVMLGKT